MAAAGLTEADFDDHVSRFDSDLRLDAQIY
jgi:hypothetical protein